jgi:hypothetical protein
MIRTSTGAAADRGGEQAGDVQPLFFVHMSTVTLPNEFVHAI